MDERLSAAIDNEACRDDINAIIDLAGDDQSVRHCWTRQYWLQTTLQSGPGDAAVPLDLGFADRVIAAIDSEESMSGKAASSGAVDRSTIVAFESERRRRHTNRTKWRSGVGTAAAASVVGVIVWAYAPLGIQNSESAPGSSSTGKPVVENASSGADTTRTVATGNAEPTKRSTNTQLDGRTQSDDRWSVSNPELRKELNGFLVEHNGLARNFGLSASTPSLVQAATYKAQTPR